MSGLRRMTRALPALLRVGLAQTVAYRSEFLIWVLSTNTPIIMMFLWRAVARDAPVGRYGEAEFAAYFISALVVRLLTGAWVVWEMNYEIRQGTLAFRLLRPIHPLLTYATENLAAVPFRLLLALPICLGALTWLGPGQFARDPWSWLLLPLVLAGAWSVTFFSMALIGTMSLYWESTVALFHFWLGLFFVFSGYIVPLSLLPPWLLGVVACLPFRTQIAFPAEVMLGHLDRRAILRLLALQWSYAACFLAAVLLLWRRGLRRYAAYGG